MTAEKRAQVDDDDDGEMPSRKPRLEINRKKSKVEQITFNKPLWITCSASDSDYHKAQLVFDTGLAYSWIAEKDLGYINHERFELSSTITMHRTVKANLVAKLYLSLKTTGIPKTHEITVLALILDNEAVEALVHDPKVDDDAQGVPVAIGMNTMI